LQHASSQNASRRYPTQATSFTLLSNTCDILYGAQDVRRSTQAQDAHSANTPYVKKKVFLLLLYLHQQKKVTRSRSE
jgi:hypothetical protein